MRTTTIASLRLAVLVVTGHFLFLPKSVLSLSASSLSSTSRQSLPAPSPTAADARFDKWCDRNGIYRVGVQTVTTPKSLGGRGLFATRQLRKGAVVASIPSELVIVEGEEGVEWQVSLTNQIMALKDDSSNEWIQSWKDSGEMAIEQLFASQQANKRVQDFIAVMEGHGCITRKGAEAEVNKRLENYHRRLKQLYSTEDASRWYSLALSRAACLGKDWDYKAGAVPFFDMLNHCHEAGNANTDLLTFGSCLDQSTMAAGGKAPNEADGVGLQRKDLLLVLTNDVAEGQELLTQYETDVVESEESQLKLWIQYGIPPPS